MFQSSSNVRNEIHSKDEKLNTNSHTFRNISRVNIPTSNLERKVFEFQMLSEFGTKLNIAESITEVVSILCNGLLKIVPESYSFVSCLDETEDCLRIKGIFGISNSSNKLFKRLGFDPDSFKLPVNQFHEKEVALYTNGHLNRIDKGLYSIIGTRVPRRICNLIERTLKVNQVMFMGFSHNCKPKGGVTILLKKSSSIDNQALIESLIKQAAITIDGIKSEIALKNSELKYRELVEKAEIAIGIDDPDGKITFCNHEFANLFGYTMEEIQAASHEQLVHPEEHPRIKHIHEARLRGEEVPDEYEFRGLRKDGKVIWILIKTARIILNGKALGTRNYFWDITNRKVNELALQVAKEKAEESDRLKSAFLANMSHEIRTPMNGIIGFSEMLGEDDLTKEEKQKYIKIINTNGDQLLRIIEDIIDISKLEAKQIIPDLDHFKINPIIESIQQNFGLVSHEKHIEFKILIAPEVPDKAFSDKYKIERILNILLSNAFKFTSSGHVYLKVYLEKDKPGWLRFEVEDTGPGVDQKNHQLIFERFSQERTDTAIRHGGTGLGLAIAKQLATILGGNIGIYSTKGYGSTFFFSIPVFYSF